MMKGRIVAVLTAVVLVGLTAFAQQVAPDFKLKDVNGVTHTLAQYAGKIVVLEWTNYECPFVRKFYGTATMQDMQELFTGKGVIWLSICSSAPGKQGNLPPEEWKQRMSASGVKATAVLLDETGVTGKAYGASNTPHIFVITADGKIAYQGAVDDKRSADPGAIDGAHNYLSEVLLALINGTPVKVAKTQPYGCSIKY